MPDGQADKSCRNVAQMLDNPELAADNFRIFLRGVRNSLKTDLAVYIAAPLDEKIMSSKLIAAITELGELALNSKGMYMALLVVCEVGEFPVDFRFRKPTKMGKKSQKSALCGYKFHNVL